MAMILLVGTDAALLEGLAQTLGAVGHRSRIAQSVAEAAEATANEPALIAVVERAIAAGSSDVLRLPLQPGGALVLFKVPGELSTPLGRSVQRLTLAELTLPLERQRLVALVQHVEERARRAGRIEEFGTLDRGGSGEMGA
jgi:DNA-binding NtrC family response regulator